MLTVQKAKRTSNGNQEENVYGHFCGEGLVKA